MRLCNHHMHVRLMGASPPAPLQGDLDAAINARSRQTGARVFDCKLERLWRGVGPKAFKLGLGADSQNSVAWGGPEAFNLALVWAQLQAAVHCAASHVLRAAGHPAAAGHNRGRRVATDIARGLACELVARPALCRAAAGLACAGLLLAGRRHVAAGDGLLRAFGSGRFLLPHLRPGADLHSCRVLHMDLKVGAGRWACCSAPHTAGDGPSAPGMDHAAQCVLSWTLQRRGMRLHLGGFGGCTPLPALPLRSTPAQPHNVLLTESGIAKIGGLLLPRLGHAVHAANHSPASRVVRDPRCRGCVQCHFLHSAPRCPLLTSHCGVLPP